MVSYQVSYHDSRLILNCKRAADYVSLLMLPGTLTQTFSKSMNVTYGTGMCLLRILTLHHSMSHITSPNIMPLLPYLSPKMDYSGHVFLLTQPSHLPPGTHFQGQLETNKEQPNHYIVAKGRLDV